MPDGEKKINKKINKKQVIMNNTNKVTISINNEIMLCSIYQFLFLPFRKAEKARNKTKDVMAKGLRSKAIGKI